MIVLKSRSFQIETIFKHSDIFAATTGKPYVKKNDFENDLIKTFKFNCGGAQKSSIMQEVFAS